VGATRWQPVPTGTQTSATSAVFSGKEKPATGETNGKYITRRDPFG
jgi:hypothetical protein